MTPKERSAQQAFETWWEREGQKFLYALNTTTDDDIKLVAEIAWKNGAYCAEQAEQEPVAEVHNTDTPSNWSIIKPGLPAGTKLYAAPVRTKDLTDDELLSELKLLDASTARLPTGFKLFARAVIAADREKNK